MVRRKELHRNLAKMVQSLCWVHFGVANLVVVVVGFLSDFA